MDSLIVAEITRNTLLLFFFIPRGSLMSQEELRQRRQSSRGLLPASKVQVPRQFMINNNMHLVVEAGQNNHAIPVKSASRTQKRNNKKKQKRARGIGAYQVKSPDQIILKAERDAATRQLIRNKKQYLVEPEEDAPKFPFWKEDVSQRKVNQKRRRRHKLLIIQCYKWQLYAIFGQMIFTKMWRIGRQDMIDALGLPQRLFSLARVSSIVTKRREQYWNRKAERRKQRMAYMKPRQGLNWGGRWSKKMRMLEYMKKVEYKKKEKERKELTNKLKEQRRAQMEKKQIYKAKTRAVPSSFKAVTKEGRRVFFPAHG